MNGKTHSQLANFIWSICNLRQGPYQRNEYRKVILPLTVLRRFFYNLSRMQFDKNADHSLLNDPNNLAPNLNSYIEQITHMAEKTHFVRSDQSLCGHRSVAATGG